MQPHRTVEVSARLDAAVGQHGGVVDRRAQLDFGCGDRRGRGVAGRAMDLRGTPQRVGVLRAGIVRPMAGHDRAALEEDPGWTDVVCPACGRNAIRSAANARSVPISASTDIAAVTSAVRSSTSRSSMARTSMPSMPSVPLISARPSLACNVIGVIPAAPACRSALTFPDRRRRRGRRGEVATGAERPVFRNGRGDPALSKSTMRSTTTGQAQISQRQRPARSSIIALTTSSSTGAHPGGVRADQRALQLFTAVGGDDGGGERSEAGGHAIDGLGRSAWAATRPASPRAPPRLRADGHRCAATATSTTESRSSPRGVNTTVRTGAASQLPATAGNYDGRVSSCRLGQENTHRLRFTRSRS